MSETAIYVPVFEGPSWATFAAEWKPGYSSRFCNTWYGMLISKLSQVMGEHMGQSIADLETMNDSQEQVQAVGKTQELKKQQAIPTDYKKFW